MESLTVTDECLLPLLDVCNKNTVSLELHFSVFQNFPFLRILILASLPVNDKVHIKNIYFKQHNLCLFLGSFVH